MHPHPISSSTHSKAITKSQPPAFPLFSVSKKKPDHSLNSDLIRGGWKRRQRAGKEHASDRRRQDRHTAAFLKVNSIRSGEEGEG